MKRPQLQILTKKQLQQARESEEFLLGVQCGANAARHLIKSGWTDMETFEREILRRVRGNQPFKLGHHLTVAGAGVRGTDLLPGADRRKRNSPLKEKRVAKH